MSKIKVTHKEAVHDLVAQQLETMTVNEMMELARELLYKRFCEQSGPLVLTLLKGHTDDDIELQGGYMNLEPENLIKEYHSNAM